MYVRSLEAFGACCSSCAHGGPCGLSGLLPTSSNEKQAAVVIAAVAAAFLFFRRKRR